MKPEDVAEKIGGIRRTEAVTVVVAKGYLCPFRNKHAGIAPTLDFCRAAHLAIKETEEDNWKIICPERGNNFGIPEECPIKTGKLKIVVKEYI